MCLHCPLQNLFYQQIILLQNDQYNSHSQTAQMAKKYTTFHHFIYDILCNLNNHFPKITRYMEKRSQPEIAPKLLFLNKNKFAPKKQSQ